MASCTFFGHRECPDFIKDQLREALIDLVTNYDVDMFYVGNQGRFDAIVRRVLRELKKEYPQINYAVVLAYIPGRQNENGNYSDTMLPEGIESVHPRYAISWRNNWMLRQSDYVVTYITHSWGGAAQYTAKAARQGKSVINLADIENDALEK
ncbi:MAG: SLOG family protein [Eubacteriales bacterium]|nr:SLOG family protein [Eubacteriales bacterium]